MRLHLALSLSVVVSAVAASPLAPRKAPVSVPLTRHLNVSPNQTVADIDQARARALKAAATQRRDASIGGVHPAPVTNAVVIYTADVLVGNPPQTFTLIVDTGSSNTWVGADAADPYVPTNSSTGSDTIIFVEYGSGIFVGLEYTDTVTVGELVIPDQIIGAAQFALGGFEGVDGILGLGPVDLTEDTTESGAPIPTITDNAWALGLLDAYEIGIGFAPPNSSSDPNGQITFGGVDASKINGSLSYVPLTTTFPASDYVGIEQSISYGSTKIPLLPTTSGIVDTGTTLLVIASDAFALYQNLTGAVLDDATGLLTISADDYENLESMFFNIGNETFEFTKNAQTWPRALNTELGGDADSIYLVVSNLGTPSGEGLDFVNGYGFLERFYAVYDTGNSQVGFAQTPFTFATTN